MTTEAIFPHGAAIRFDPKKMAELPEGPWQSEPWQVTWTDPETQLTCELKRNLSGAWCGYVYVPLSHPWAPTDGTESVSTSDDRFDNVEIHWGITFARVLNGLMCVGFDCSHLYDTSPAMAEPYGSEYHSIYRDMAYAKRQVESLARQAKEAEGTDPSARCNSITYHVPHGVSQVTANIFGSLDSSPITTVIDAGGGGGGSTGTYDFPTPCIDNFEAMTTPKLIYIAGPYRAKTLWEVECNIRNAELAGIRVARMGAYPVIPHSNTRNYFADEAPAQLWRDGTMELLRRCDAVFMSWGWRRSTGSLAEHAEAVRLNIPVHLTLEDLGQWLAL